MNPAAAWSWPPFDPNGIRGPHPALPSVGDFMGVEALQAGEGAREVSGGMERSGRIGPMALTDWPKL